MSARHQETANTYTKKKAVDTQNQNFSLVGKGMNWQHPYVVEPRPVLGGGFAVGTGASYPLLAPIIDLGNLAADFVFDLANQTLHYMKFAITKVGGLINFSFNGLVNNRAVTFSLDISIGVVGAATIVWPANLYGVPSGLPTTNGSRYTLYVTGFRDSAGVESYFVVGSSIPPSGGGSTNWSSIVIDAANISKSMRLGNLIDLDYLKFDTVFDGKERQIRGHHGIGFTFDLGTAGTPTSAEDYFFKINDTEIFRIESSRIAISAPIDMQSQPINNSNTITPDGDQTRNLGSTIRRWVTTYTSAVGMGATQAIDFTVLGGQNTKYTVPVNNKHSFYIGGAEAMNIGTSNGLINVSTNIDPTTDHVYDLGSSTFGWGRFFLGDYTNISGMVNGEFRRNGTDIFAFSGGVARNLSYVPSFTAADIHLSNIANTITIPDGVILAPLNSGLVELGSSGSMFDNCNLAGALALYESTSATSHYLTIYKQLASPYYAYYNYNDAAHNSAGVHGHAFFINSGSPEFKILVGTTYAVNAFDVGAATTLHGNVTLGNSTSNSLFFNGLSTTDFMPVDGAWNLGGSSNWWVSIFSTTHYFKNTSNKIWGDGSDNIAYVVPVNKKHSFTVAGSEAMNIGTSNGSVNYTAHAIPTTTNAFDLGSSSKYWGNAYIYTLNVNAGGFHFTGNYTVVSNGEIGFDGTSITARTGSTTTVWVKSSLNNLTTTSINKDLIPDSDDVRSLGTSSLAWFLLYGYEYLTPPSTFGAARFSIDATLNQASFSTNIVNNGTATIFASNDFAGLLIITNATDASNAVFLIGVATSTMVANTGGNWSATSGTASKSNCYVSSHAVILENKRGSSQNYQVFAIRTNSSGN